jgi:hypothetical protein
MVRRRQELDVLHMGVPLDVCHRQRPAVHSHVLEHTTDNGAACDVDRLVVADDQVTDLVDVRPKINDPGIIGPRPGGFRGVGKEMEGADPMAVHLDSQRFRFGERQTQAQALPDRLDVEGRRQHLNGLDCFRSVNRHCLVLDKVWPGGAG